MCSKKKSVQKKKKPFFFLLLLLLSQKKDELLLESVNFRFSTKCAYEKKKKKLKETPQLRLRKEYGLTSAPKTDTSGDTQLKEKRFADDACKVAKRSSGGCKTSRFSKESCLHETSRNTPPLHLLCSLNRLSMHGAFMESVKKKKKTSQSVLLEKRGSQFHFPSSELLTFSETLSSSLVPLPLFFHLLSKFLAVSSIAHCDAASSNNEVVPCWSENQNTQLHLPRVIVKRENGLFLKWRKRWGRGGERRGRESKGRDRFKRRRTAFRHTTAHLVRCSL